MAREARVTVGLTLVACKWPVGNATVEIWYTAPWPYLITYHNVPLYNIIANAVAPYAMGVRPPIIRLTAVVIPGLIIITVVSLTHAYNLAAAVRTHNHSNIHVRRYPSTRVYAKKSFSGFYDSKTLLHYRLYIQIYRTKYAMCDSFF